MHYNIGDIVKLDVSRQEIISPFGLSCPYITITAEYSEDIGGALWGNSQMYDERNGTPLPDTNYFFNRMGSTLVRDVMAVSGGTVSIEHDGMIIADDVPHDDVMMAEWLAAYHEADRT